MKRRSLLVAGACVPLSLSARDTLALPPNYENHEVKLSCLGYPDQLLIQWFNDVSLGQYTLRPNNIDENHDYLWGLSFNAYEEKDSRREGFSITSWNTKYLQGRPLNGTVGIGSLYDGGSVHWDITDAGGGAVFIRCQSRVEGPHWLEGRPGTQGGTIGLAHNAQPSTRWQIIVEPNSLDNLNSYFGNRRR
jgi:hypothetical protein